MIKSHVEQNASVVLCKFLHNILSVNGEMSVNISSCFQFKI